MPENTVHEWGDGSHYLNLCEKIKSFAKRGGKLRRGFCILDDVGYLLPTSLPCTPPCAQGFGPSSEKCHFQNRYQMNRIAYKMGDKSGNQNMIILRHLRLSHFMTSQYFTTRFCVFGVHF